MSSKNSQKTIKAINNNGSKSSLRKYTDYKTVIILNIRYKKLNLIVLEIYPKFKVRDNTKIRL